MPINIQQVDNELERENHALSAHVDSLSKDPELTPEQAQFGALIAINLSIYQRLGDLISLTLRTR